MDKPLENFGLQKDMQDIDDILNQYFQIGRINREKAIAKIRELRITNEDVGRTVMAVLPYNFIPFSDASDAQLASELHTYKEILAENYLRNTQEEMPYSSTEME